MKFKVKNFDLLKEGLTILAEVVDEGSIRFSQEDGVRLVAMDGAKGCIFNLKLSSSNLSDFEDVENVESVINVKDFKNRLMKIQNADNLFFQVKDSKLVIMNNDANFKKEFAIPLYDKETNFEIPKIEFEVEVEINAKVMNETIDNIEAEKVLVCVQKEKTLFSAIDNSKKYDIALSGNNINVKKIENVAAEAKYAYAYLLSIKSASKISNVLNLKLKTNNLAKLVYDNKDKGICLTCILCPRIDPE
jgi:hypothetical protein